MPGLQISKIQLELVHINCIVLYVTTLNRDLYIHIYVYTYSCERVFYSSAGIRRYYIGGFYSVNVLQNLVSTDAYVSESG